MRHDAFIDTDQTPILLLDGGFLGRCACGWRGPNRRGDREWAQEDCTWHETQMRIEKDCDHSVVGNCPHYS